jgi:hypothetical protein
MSQELERIAASRAREAVNMTRWLPKLRRSNAYREAIDILWSFTS